MGKKKIHKGCGGTIVKGKCLKCGKVWGKLKGVFSEEIAEKEEVFDTLGYRRRIRGREDIP